MIWREHFGVEYRPGRMVYLTEQEVTRCKGVKEEEAGNRRAVQKWKLSHPTLSIVVSGTLPPLFIWLESLCVNVCVYCASLLLMSPAASHPPPSPFIF